MSDQISLRVKLDASIPKLLVKVSAQDACVFGLRNLGEVNLQKENSSSGSNPNCSKVAVINISHAVAQNEILMSSKLAETLSIQDGEFVGLKNQSGGTNGQKNSINSSTTVGNGFTDRTHNINVTSSFGATG